MSTSTLTKVAGLVGVLAAVYYFTRESYKPSEEGVEFITQFCHKVYPKLADAQKFPPGARSSPQFQQIVMSLLQKAMQDALKECGREGSLQEIMDSYDQSAPAMQACGEELDKLIHGFIQGSVSPPFYSLPEGITVDRILEIHSELSLSAVAALEDAYEQLGTEMGSVIIMPQGAAFDLTEEAQVLVEAINEEKERALLQPLAAAFPLGRKDFDTAVAFIASQDENTAALKMLATNLQLKKMTTTQRIAALLKEAELKKHATIVEIPEDEQEEKTEEKPEASEVAVEEEEEAIETAVAESKESTPEAASEETAEEAIEVVEETKEEKTKEEETKEEAAVEDEEELDSDAEAIAHAVAQVADDEEVEIEVEVADATPEQEAAAEDAEDDAEAIANQVAQVVGEGEEVVEVEVEDATPEQEAQDDQE